MRSHNLSQYDIIAKIVLAGSHGVGKTSILTRYVDQTYQQRYITTIGIDFKMKIETINNSRVKFQIWDHAGSERFRSLVSTYYRGSHGIIIIFDLTNAESFQVAKQRLAEVRSQEQIGGVQKNIVLMLLGNKCDDKENRVVDDRDIQQFARNNGLIYLQSSAKENINITQAFRILGTEILKNYTPPTNQPVRPVIRAQRQRWRQEELPEHVEQKLRWYEVGAPAVLLALFILLALVTNS